jgi:hypothetical protein
MNSYKRDFIKKLAHGVRDLMEHTNYVNKIGFEPQNDIELFIRDRLFIHNRDGTYEFSVGKFRIALDTADIETLTFLFRYLDNIDITIDRVYTLASPNPDLLTKSDRKIIHLLNIERIKTFQDFLSY